MERIVAAKAGMRKVRTDETCGMCVRILSVGISRPSYAANLRYSEIAADFPRESFADFVVPGHGRATVRRHLPPPRVTGAFAKELASVSRQMPQQIAAFHTAIGSSS
jgi:hypothetical protein